jgi:hypothetical protein
MNTLNQSQEKGKFGVSSEGVLAILGLVGLLQVVLFFSLGFEQAQADAPLRSAMQIAPLQTNAPLVHAAGAAALEKLSSFHFATTPR